MHTRSVTSQDAIEFCLDWIERRTSVAVEPYMDIFDTVGLDSLDLAILLDELQVYVGAEYDLSILSDWTSIRTPHGLVTNLFPGLA